MNEQQKQAIEQLQAALLACTEAGVFVATDDGCSGYAAKLGEVHTGAVEVGDEAQTAVFLCVEPEAYEMIDTDGE